MDYWKEPFVPSKRRRFNWTDFKEWSIYMSVAIASAVSASLWFLLLNIQWLEMNSNVAMIAIFGIGTFIKRLATDYTARYGKTLPSEIQDETSNDSQI